MRTFIAKISSCLIVALFAVAATSCSKDAEEPKVIAVTNVTVSPTTVGVLIGGKTTLTASVLPADATNKTLSWKSLHPQFATVADGVVTGVSAGVADIEVKAGGKIAIAKVTVTATAIPVETVTMSQATLELVEGKSKKLSFTLDPPNATNQTAEWDSDDDAIATVDQSGNVTAVGEGSTDITVTVDGKSDICTVTVSAPTPDPDDTVYENFDFQIGSARNMTATKVGDYHYMFNATSGDPYIYTTELTESLDPTYVVLTFEYKSSQNISEMQIFFGNSITEQRSVRTPGLTASSEWQTWSFVALTQIVDFNWGNAGEFIRLDLGNDAGPTVEVKNLHFRKMNQQEQEEAQNNQNQQYKDQMLNANIGTYLSKTYDSEITHVNAQASTITVTGTCVGSGTFRLCEITPYMDVTELTSFPYKTTVSGSFSQPFDRYVDRNGVKYDRTLSKWVIVKSTDKEEIVSHARYADEIYASQATSPATLASKKGLGGIFNNGTQRQDLIDLDIKSATINITISAFMYTTPGGNRIAHQYGNNTYYFDGGAIADLDGNLKACADQGIVVAAIILLPVNVPDAEIGNRLRHPANTGSPYTMPNMTTAEGVETYAAALDFLAGRYCIAGSPNGRIHHWIMHNEVDAGIEWTNMGVKPMRVYMDTYIKSMRMCYNIARQYDRYTEVFGSFTHSWTSSVGNAGYFPTRDMLDLLNDYCKVEGDFQWGLAYHPYPQDLTQPKTWLDSRATYMMNTPLITFKNLEVLDKWAKDRDNQYQSTTKRSVWLSENGTNSRSYSEKDLAEQAAGFAWAWKKIEALDGIDGIQWHNWHDHPDEAKQGLRIGLRTSDLQPKPVWYAYQAAGTAEEDVVFAPYLSVIGIPDWNILETVY